MPTKPRIGILAPEHYCIRLQELMEYYHIDYSETCTLAYYPYQHMEEQLAIYEAAYEECDGFCVSGTFSKVLLRRVSAKQEKPIVCFFGNSLEIYKEFFDLLNKNRSLDLSRVTVDFSFWLGGDIPLNVVEYTSSDRRFMDMLSKVKDSVPTEKILGAEKRIVEEASRLYDEGKIDWVVCRFASAFPLLQQAGVPCSYVYPVSDSIVDTLDLLLSKIKMAQMDGEMPAVLYVSSPLLKQDSITGLNAHSLQLQTCLLDFDREYTTSFVMKESADGIEIYTTQQAVKLITDYFTECQLKKYIFSRTGIAVQIGYGIGNTVMRARKHAWEALQAALRGNKSYVVDLEGKLIGPLEQPGGKEKKAAFSKAVLTAAADAGLSAATVQRILTASEVLGTKELTTQELADVLKVTVANANRVLNALQKSGHAQVVSEKRSPSKGRPSRVYELMI